MGSDNSKSQSPSSIEKLSFKFILDEMREVVGEDPIAEPKEKLQEIVQSQLQKQVEEEGEIHPVLQEEIKITPTGYKPVQIDPEKKYFRVGEVADLLGVEPYVLRYWENEFSMLKPEKSSSGHRVYTKKDVDTLHYIQYLLHVEKYSLKGAKAKLKEERSNKMEASPLKPANHDFLKEIAKDLKELIHIARGNSGVF